MKIATKLTLSILISVCLVIGAGIFTIRKSWVLLERTIGDNLMVIASETLAAVDRDIANHITQIQLLSQRRDFQAIVLQSTRYFNAMENQDAYINDNGKAWVEAPADQPKAFMREVIDNPAFSELRNILKFSEIWHDKKVFGEILVTNQYGVKIIHTGRTSNNRHDDESWWQTTKRDGLLVGEIAYDKSAGIYSLDICVRIDDKKGRFLGVMKAAMRLDVPVRHLKDLMQYGNFQSTKYKLVSNSGMIIYSSEIEKNQAFIPLPQKIFSRINVTHKTAGYFFWQGDSKVEKQKFIVYAFSKNEHNQPGRRWFLMLEHEVEEIFSSAIQLRNIMIGISILIVILSLIVKIIISYNISRPLKLLSHAAISIGRGIFKPVTGIRSRDEIGDIASSFNLMVQSLKETTVSRDALIKEVKEHSQAAAELEESEKRFMDVIYTSKDAIVIIDCETFVDCNQAAVQMLGYSNRLAFLLTHPSELSPPTQADGRASHEKANDMMRIALEKGYHRFEWVYKKTNKEHFPVEVSLIPITLKRKSVIYCRWQEITESKKVADQMRLLAVVAEQSPTSVVVTDIHGNIQYVNAKFEKVSGYAREEVIGKNSRILKSGETPQETYKELWQTITGGSEWRGEFHNKRKDGSFYWELAAIGPIRDLNNKITSFLAVKEDITEKRKVTAQLLQAQKMESVGQLAGDIGEKTS